MSQKKRLKRMPMSFEFLAEFFKNGETHFKIESGLPKDAKVTAIYPELPSFRGFNECVWLIIESKEFPELEEAREIPKLDSPIFTVLKCKKEKK